MPQKAFSNAVTIYMDNRESKTKVAAILKKKCTLREKHLDTADYLLSNNAACERKTVDDFLQSIIDGRLFRQLKALKEIYPKPLLVIEGLNLFGTERKIHPNAIRGAIASIACELCVPIIWARNQHETAEIMLAIAKREQLGIKNSVGIRTKKKAITMNQLQEFLVAGFPEISTITARKLLKHFGSPGKIFNASESELMKVDGIGEKTARRIREILTKKYEKSILEE